VDSIARGEKPGENGHFRPVWTAEFVRYQQGGVVPLKLAGWKMCIDQFAPVEAISAARIANPGIFSGK
jgi:hypothetical protein